MHHICRVTAVRGFTSCFCCRCHCNNCSCHSAGASILPIITATNVPLIRAIVCIAVTAATSTAISVTPSSLILRLSPCSHPCHRCHHRYCRHSPCAVLSLPSFSAALLSFPPTPLVCYLKMPLLLSITVVANTTVAVFVPVVRSATIAAICIRLYPFCCCCCLIVVTVYVIAHVCCTCTLFRANPAPGTTIISPPLQLCSSFYSFFLSFFLLFFLSFFFSFFECVFLSFFLCFFLCFFF